MAVRIFTDSQIPSCNRQFIRPLIETESPRAVLKFVRCHSQRTETQEGGANQLLIAEEKAFLWHVVLKKGVDLEELLWWLFE